MNTIARSALSVSLGLALSSSVHAQAIQIYNGNVGIGTPTAAEKLDVVGNERLAGYLKFSNLAADSNDGKIGSSLFAQGLNLVGINNDSTYRKIQLWGEITQQQNNGTNTWAGANLFAGSVRFSAYGAGVLGTDAAGNLGTLTYGLNGASVLLRTNSEGNLVLDNWIRGTGLYTGAGDVSSLDGSYLQVRSPYGIVVAQRDGAPRGYIYYDSSENFGLLNKSRQWAIRTTNAGTQLYGDTVATWIHDAEASNFVLDLNGQSRIHEVLVSSMLGTYAGYDSGRYGERVYEWGYQEGGAWSFPYPDLVIGFHTGLKLGGNVSYGGTRFYADHPSASSNMLFSVGDGDTNVRVTNNLYVGATAQAASFRSTSSGRWKDNVATLASALDLVRSLRGVSYEWKKGTSLAGQRDVGFIAEEVDRVLPEIVGHDPDGSANSIDYSRLSAVLVEAVKSLDQQTGTTAGEIALLRAQTAALQLQAEQLASTRWLFLAVALPSLAIGFIIGSRRARRQS